MLNSTNDCLSLPVARRNIVLLWCKPAGRQKFGGMARGTPKRDEAGNSLSNFMHLQRMEIGTRLRRAIWQRGDMLADWIVGGTEEARTRRGRAHGRVRGACCWVHC